MSRPNTSSLVTEGSRFYDMCKERAIDNQIMLTFSNFGYLDMLLNWVYNIQIKLGITNYVIVSLDRATYDALNSLAIDVMKKYYDSEHCSFNSVEFMAICNEKPFLANEILKAGFDCLWTDTDIIFFKDPFPVFKEQPNVDIQFQSDDDDICAGFFYAKSNPNTIAFWDKVVAYTREVVVLDDQSVTRRFLHDAESAVRMGIASTDEDNEGFMHDHSMKRDKMEASTSPLSATSKGSPDPSLVKYYVLDRVRFPNGSAFFNAKLPQRLGVVPYIVHNNCIIGHDSKVERFQMYDMWWMECEDNPYRLNKPAALTEVNSVVCSPLNVLRGHIEIVVSLAVRNEVLYSSGYDKMVLDWDMQADDCKHVRSRYLNKRGGVWCMAFSADGSLLFTGGHDRKLMAWNTSDWSQKTIFKGHVGIINSVAVSGDSIFSASDDGDVFSWDANTGERRKIYRSHRSWVSCVAVDGPVLYSASKDGTACAWEIKTGRVLQLYKGHEGWVRTLAIQKSKNGSMFLWTAGEDGTARQWNVRAGTCVSVVKHGSGINALAFDSDTDILYTAGDNNTIKAWNVTSGLCVAEYVGHKGIVSCLAVHGPYLYSGSYDKTVIRWKKVTQQ